MIERPTDAELARTKEVLQYLLDSLIEHGAQIAPYPADQIEVFEDVMQCRHNLWDLCWVRLFYS